MPENLSKEQLLELKLQWIKYKINAVQYNLSCAAMVLKFSDKLLEEMEKKIASARNNHTEVGAQLNAAYWELEELKRL